MNEFGYCAERDAWDGHESNEFGILVCSTCGDWLEDAVFSECYGCYQQSLLEESA